MKQSQTTEQCGSNASSDGRIATSSILPPFTGITGQSERVEIARHTLGDLTAPQVASVADSHRYGLQAKRHSYSQQVQYYTHWLNLPFIEQYPLIKSRYLFLRNLVMSWDVNHPDTPWFFLHRQLALLTPEESDSINNDDDSRRAWFLKVGNRDRLCERLASWSVAADVVGKMVAGSFANLCIYSRYTGDDQQMRIASSFRWNVINRRCHHLGTYVLPNGIFDYVAKHSSVLSGVSPTRAPMFSFPMWITDCWGNRGDHEFDWTCYLSEVKTPDNAELVAHPGETHVIDSVDTALDSTKVARLIQRCYAVADRYMYGCGYMMTCTSGDANLAASMPRIENGATWTMKKTDTVDEKQQTRAVRIPCNADCQMYGYTTDKKYENPKTTGKPEPLLNLVDKLWRNFKFWTSEYTASYAPLINCESEISKFFIEWGWFEAPRDIHDVFKAITDKEYGSMSAWAQNMVYRGTSRPSTNTIVKLDLPTSASSYMSDDGYLQVTDEQDNVTLPMYWERFSLRANSNTAAEVETARFWPSLTPAVFFHREDLADALAEQYPETSEFDGGITRGEILQGVRVNGAAPAVFNTTPQYLGLLMPGTVPHPYANEPSIKSQLSYWVTRGGKFEDRGAGSVLIDLAKSQTNGMARSELITQGVDPNEIIKDINEYAGIVTYEDPAKQWCFVQPLVDNTDIYQCGFNAWFNYDRIGIGRYDENYLTFLNYTKNTAYAIEQETQPLTTDYVNGTYSAESGLKFNQAGSLTSKRSDAIQVAAHVTSSKYMATIRDAFVFVGAAPFYTIRTAARHIQAALPYQVVDSRWRQYENAAHEKGAADFGYRELSKHIRAFRETSTTVNVFAHADGWDSGSTDARLVIPWKSSGSKVKTGDTLFYLLALGNDTDWSEIWSIIEKEGILQLAAKMWARGEVSLKPVLCPSGQGGATIEGYWYNMKASKRVNEGAYVGRIETNGLKAFDVPWGFVFLRNKAEFYPGSQPGHQASDYLPTFATEVYDLLTNELNDQTASGALNMESLTKFMFDPAYGAVLPIVKGDLASGYLAASSYFDCVDGSEGTVKTKVDWVTNVQELNHGFVPSVKGRYGEYFRLMYDAQGLGPAYTNGHRWSREIASVSLQGTTVSIISGIAQPHAQTIKGIDFIDCIIDSDLINAVEGKISCANAGHLPSLMDVIPKINLALGDEGIITASGSGPTAADVVNEPRQRNTYLRSHDAVGGAEGGDAPSKDSRSSINNSANRDNRTGGPSTSKRKHRNRHARTRSRNASQTRESQYNVTKSEDVERNTITRDDVGIADKSDALAFDKSLKKPTSGKDIMRNQVSES